MVTGNVKSVRELIAEQYMTVAEISSVMGFKSDGHTSDKLKAWGVSYEAKDGAKYLYRRSVVEPLIAEYLANREPKPTGRSPEVLEGVRQLKISANAPIILAKLEEMDQKLDRLLVLWK